MKPEAHDKSALQKNKSALQKYKSVLEQHSKALKQNLQDRAVKTGSQSVN